MYISAQNTVLNKSVPDFCFKDLSDGQVLTWDKDKKSFVNTNVIDLALEQAQGVDDIKLYQETAIGTQSLYVVPWVAVSEASLIVTLDGVKQQQGAYTITAYDTYTNVQFADVIPAGVDIEIVGLIVEDVSAIKFFATTGDGVSVNFNLPWIAPSKESLIITIGGIKQQQDAYDITVLGNSTQLTFNGVPLATDDIEVVGITGDFGTTNFGITDVQGTNLGIGEGVFESSTTAGQTSYMNFKGFVAGAGIELSSDSLNIMISKAPIEVTYTNAPGYTFGPTDNVKVFETTTPVTCTVPLNSIVDFPIGHEIVCVQNNTGIITFDEQPGVTIKSLNGALNTKGEGSVAKLRKIYVDTWVLSGDIV